MPIILIIFETNFSIILSEATKSMMTGRPIGLKISQNLNKNLTRGITNRKILNKILKDFERSDHIMRGVLSTPKHPLRMSQRICI